jgi:hypothetical protein
VPILGRLFREGRSGLLKPTTVRLDALEARQTALESRGLAYVGVFQRAATYRRGSVVTHEGSAWIATVDAEGVEPGDGKIWQLLVKRGRDGKDR